MSKRKRRVSPRTIFIACEGTNTEPNYFKGINEAIEDDEEFVITVYPDKNEKNPKQHAIGLVLEAQSRIEDFDEVWAVFDKDGYTKHQEAFAKAAEEFDIKEGNNIVKKKVNIAFSSIAFEHWVLLHFERNQTGFIKSECKGEDKKSLKCGTNTHPNDCQG